jgi:hypothetical protein
VFAGRIQERTLNSGKPAHWLLTTARIIARGFLLGLGFGLALWLVYCAAWHWTMNNVKEQAGVGESNQQAVRAVVLSDVEEQKHDGITAIIGKATNSGKTSVAGVHIQANLFDHTKFVDQYSTYLTGPLAPGTSQFFKISCGCKDTPPAEHDSYKLEVLGGF